MYSEINNAFNTNEDLDKIAREVNNKKSRLSRQVVDQYESSKRDWKNGIKSLLSDTDGFAKVIHKKPKIFNNTTDKMSDYDSRSNDDNSFSIDTPIFSDQETCTTTHNNYNNTHHYNTDNRSIDSINSLDSLIEIAEDQSRNGRDDFKDLFNSVHYDSCSNKDRDIFSHLKKCTNCKNKLLKVLNLQGNFQKKVRFNDTDTNFNENYSYDTFNKDLDIPQINHTKSFFNSSKNIEHFDKTYSDKKYTDKKYKKDRKSDKKYSMFFKSRGIKSKEIIITIIIGICVIFFLDLLLKTKATY